GGELAARGRARDGQFAPLLRAALGRRSALVLDAAWSTTAHHNLDQPRIRNTLSGALADLPPATAETRDATMSLLAFRGEALFAVGRPEEARRALADALALVHPRASSDARGRSERAAVLLAIDSAARGDEAAARRLSITALDVAEQPELAADLLLLDPGIRALAGGPGWERIRALGRPVAGAPPR